MLARACAGWGGGGCVGRKGEGEWEGVVQQKHMQGEHLRPLPKLGRRDASGAVSSLMDATIEHIGREMGCDSAHIAFTATLPPLVYSVRHQYPSHESGLHFNATFSLYWGWVW